MTPEETKKWLMFYDRLGSNREMKRFSQILSVMRAFAAGQQILGPFTEDTNKNLDFCDWPENYVIQQQFSETNPAPLGVRIRDKRTKKELGVTIAPMTPNADVSIWVGPSSSIDVTYQTLFSDYEMFYLNQWQPCCFNTRTH